MPSVKSTSLRDEFDAIKADITLLQKKARVQEWLIRLTSGCADRRRKSRLPSASNGRTK